MKPSWQTKRLGDVFEIIKGRKPPLQPSRSAQVLPYLTAKAIRGSQEPEYASVSDPNSVIVSENETIIICDGSNSGEVFTGHRGILSSTMGKVSKTPALAAVVDDSYLRAFLGSLFDVVNGAKTGAAIPHLDKGAMYALPFPIPPLAEQRRIVGILDEAFEGIATMRANAERNLNNAHALFESHVYSIFKHRGSGWVERRLGDVVTRLTNGFVGPTRNRYFDSGVPYLLARHVRSNRLAFDGKPLISDEFNRQNKKSVLKAGDVLLVQSGHIGHSAVVPEEHEGHNCHAMIVITPISGVVTGAFLSLYFNSPEMRARFNEIRSGSTVPHLTCRAVKEMMVALPDSATQRRIVERSQEMRSETEQLGAIYQRKLAALDGLKRSLLQSAFAGRL